MINQKLLEKARLKGTDAEYQEYVRRWPSCVSGAYAYWKDGVGYSEYSHHRTVEGGAGVARKPEYSGRPLTSAEHALTHQKGESVFAPKEWWDEQSAIYLCRWLNDVEPPECLEQEEFADREYKIKYAGQLIGLWLRLKDYFAVHSDRVVTVTLKFARRRTLKQNNTLWSDAIHGHQAREYNKRKEIYFTNLIAAHEMQIQKTGITTKMVHEMNKMLHNDGKSTTQLDANNGFSAYVDKIRNFDRDVHGIEYPEIITPYYGEYDDR